MALELGDQIVGVENWQVALSGLPDEREGIIYLVSDEVLLLAESVGRDDFVGADDIAITLAKMQEEDRCVQPAS